MAAVAGCGYCSGKIWLTIWESQNQTKTDTRFSTFIRNFISFYVHFVKHSARCCVFGLGIGFALSLLSLLLSHGLRVAVGVCVYVKGILLCAHDEGEYPFLWVITNFFARFSFPTKKTHTIFTLNCFSLSLNFFHLSPCV